MRMISQVLREECRDDTLPTEFYRGRRFRSMTGSAPREHSATSPDVESLEQADVQDVRFEGGMAHLDPTEM